MAPRAKIPCWQSEWCGIKKMFPKVTVWETCAPYFETRNIHFYVNG
ncbi:MAG: hypothetical protein J6D02_05630 [Lachnospira sp.]|nr:hypothetical protein [Lachnospira sp.]